MADENMCECGKPGERVSYTVKATGHTIRPKPRCPDCQAEYEAPRTGLVRQEAKK